MRIDGRANDALRPVTIVPHYLEGPEGSALIEFGKTKVICTASVDFKVPPFRKDSGLGWVTAEYGMLPGSTQSRMVREASRGKISGRTAEIQRLIGRSLRSIVQMEAIPNLTITLDCDVIQADGGTRTASITGAYVALCLACDKLLDQAKIGSYPVLGHVAAVSLGVVQNEVLVDLCYEEDSRAEVDLNLVMTGEGSLIEIQGTAEQKPFSKDQLGQMLSDGTAAIEQLVAAQKKALGLN